MNIGEQIRKLRKDKNLTMKELGSLVGVSEQAIGNYERGDREPNMATLQKITDSLDISIDEFFKYRISYGNGTDITKEEAEILNKEFQKQSMAISSDISKIGKNELAYFNNKINLTPIDSDFTIYPDTKFLLSNTFNVDLGSLTEHEVLELMTALRFTIKLKMQEFKKNTNKDY